jgi:hypothetical protein
LLGKQTAEKGIDEAAALAESAQSVEPTVLEISIRTPPRKPPQLKPESTDRKSLLDMAKERRASRSLFFDSSPAKPGAEVFPGPKEEGDAERPICVSLESTDGEVAMASPLRQGSAPRLESPGPGRKSLADMAKEKRASRSSLGESSETKSSGEISSGRRMPQVAPIPDDARGTIVETALLGQHPGQQNAKDDSTNESTVSRLARLKREEKMNKSESLPSVQELSQEETRNESTFARLARLKREDKVKASSTSLPTPPPKESHASRLNPDPSPAPGLALGALTALSVGVSSEAEIIPTKTPCSPKKESAMVRMARMKREEKKSTMD